MSDLSDPRFNVENASRALVDALRKLPSVDDWMRERAIQLGHDFQRIMTDYEMANYLEQFSGEDDGN